MNATARLTASILMLAAFSTGSGCKSIPRPDGMIVGPFYRPKNIRASATMPHSVARIVMIPLTGPDSVSAESLSGIGIAFANEFTRTGRAELTLLDSDRMQRLVGERGVSTTAPLPADFLARLRAGTAADAVLFVEVTAFRAYPPLTLGIRGRLVTTDSQESLWACDELFDAAAPSVRNAARRHAARPAPQPGAPGDLSHTILQSPDRFAAYVAASLLSTLPAR
jgi:hypothetical protein